ncbi:MAG: alpha/beta hydrolase [Planctomycetota bacterium]
MFLITNRHIQPHVTFGGVEILGDTVSNDRMNDLRVLEASVVDGADHLTVIRDRLDNADIDSLETLTPTEIARLAAGPAPDHDDQDGPWHGMYGSRLVADRLVRDGRDVVLFVHGYNTNVEAALRRSREIEENYDVQVVLFCWPSDGRTIRYNRDKLDARLSASALHRVIEIAASHLELLRGGEVERLVEEARNAHPADRERRDARVAERVAASCPVKLALIAHSMGNYLLKHVFNSSLASRLPVLFDNVLLSAADTNRRDHASWVDCVPHRNRLYVCINEDDYALGLSRLKGGEQQLTRLGHSVKGLDARSATYVDFTGAQHVGKSHTYFGPDANGEDALQNAEVRAFFDLALHGQRPEERLPYDESRNLYRLAGLAANR